MYIEYVHKHVGFQLWLLKIIVISNEKKSMAYHWQVLLFLFLQRGKKKDPFKLLHCTKTYFYLLFKNTKNLCQANWSKLQSCTCTWSRAYPGFSSTDRLQLNRLLVHHRFTCTCTCTCTYMCVVSWNLLTLFPLSRIPLNPIDWWAPRTIPIAKSWAPTISTRRAYWNHVNKTQL